MARKPMELLVFGAGAVGSVFGWRAAQNAGVRLSVVCRSNYDIVKRQGLQFKTDMWGDGALYPDRVVRHPNDLQHVDFDFVICANKSIPHKARSIAESLRPVVREHTTLVTVQNGVEVEQPLRSVYPSNTILSSVCYISCMQSTMGMVDQVSKLKPHAFHIGTYGEGNTNRAIDSKKLQQLVALDSKFKEIDGITEERWGKMIFNGAWNPTTALLGLDTHQIIQGSPIGLMLVRKLANEISQVGRISGAQPPEDLDEMIIRSAATAPAIVPSMLQDARKRQQMEVEAICGTICRIADRFGLPVPTVKATYRSLVKMNRNFLEDLYPEEAQEPNFFMGMHSIVGPAAPLVAL